MPKKLKTYVTSLGFFDQAVAAPSMKAALAAWGADSNLFHQGIARESTDPDVIAATLAHPGIVLKRPVGSNGPFRENAALPTQLPGDHGKGRPSKAEAKKHKPPARKIDDPLDRKATLAFERAERERESQRRKDEAARAKQQAKRQRAIAEAEAALEKARQEHEDRLSAFEAERAAIDKRSQAEAVRWEREKERLKQALRRARE
jgi:hypothetical protein